MAIDEQGREGERIFMDYLRWKRLPVGDKFQPDAMFKHPKYGWCIAEVKNQEHYHAPPFDGHGLPPYQVKARLKFYEETGIRCLFFVHEAGTNLVYAAWLDELDAGPKVLSKSGGRVIYPLESFGEPITLPNCVVSAG